jgi:AraC family transcriptional regulator
MSTARLSVGSSIERLEPGIASALLKLLAEANEIVNRDRAGAKARLDQAAAILESEGVVVAIDPSGARQVLAPWQVRRIATYIDENLGGAIRIYDLAKLARLTVSYFSRAFKGSFGVTPQAYVTARRMELACRLMLTTDDSLCQISLACGLSDQAHFSKMFSRVHGLPPGVWRRGRRGCVMRR